MTTIAVEVGVGERRDDLVATVSSTVTGERFESDTLFRVGYPGPTSSGVVGGVPRFVPETPSAMPQ